MALETTEIQTMLQLYLADESVSAIARRCGVSRKTVYNHINEGTLTDGINWKTYKEELEAKQISIAKERSLRKAADEAEEFYTRAQDDVYQIYEQIVAQLKNGTVKFDVNDLNTLIKLSAMLDNQGADKMAWMEGVMRQIFEVAIEIMNDRQFAQFKNKMKMLHMREQKKLGDVTNASMQVSN